MPAEPIMPEDREGQPIPVLRPDVAQESLSVGTAGATMDITAETLVVSLFCLGDTGKYILGDVGLTGNEGVHFINNGERLTFKCDSTDVKIAVKALNTTADFYLTELT